MEFIVKYKRGTENEPGTLEVLRADDHGELKTENILSGSEADTVYGIIMGFLSMDQRIGYFFKLGGTDE